MRKTSTSGSEDGLNRGAWTATEDKMLTDYITIHGAGKWSHIPKKTDAADLKRCGKSCRLRWLNYLRPNIKRGNISVDEEELIIRLHNLLGNRWSLIAGRLPGRTDNEIKNYWNTHLVKKAQKQQLQKKLLNKISSDCQPGPSRVNESACTKKDKDVIARSYENDSSTDIPSLVSGDHENSYDFFVDFNVEDFCRTLDSDLMMRRASAANQNAQPSDFISLVSFLDSDVQWPAINSVNTN